MACRHLQAAQEREELQAAGDALDAKITQCEAEVRDHTHTCDAAVCVCLLLSLAGSAFHCWHHILTHMRMTAHVLRQIGTNRCNSVPQLRFATPHRTNTG